MAHIPATARGNAQFWANNSQDGRTVGTCQWNFAFCHFAANKHLEKAIFGTGSPIWSSIRDNQRPQEASHSETTAIVKRSNIRYCRSVL